MDQDKVDEWLEECASEEIKCLFKSFLGILQDMKSDHDVLFKKLKKNFPELEKTLEVSNNFDDDKMQALRKRVLDIGNDTVRKNRIQMQTIRFKFRNK